MRPLRTWWVLWGARSLSRTGGRPIPRWPWWACSRQTCPATTTQTTNNTMSMTMQVQVLLMLQAALMLRQVLLMRTAHVELWLHLLWVLPRLW